MKFDEAFPPAVSACLPSLSLLIKLKHTLVEAQRGTATGPMPVSALASVSNVTCTLRRPKGPTATRRCPPSSLPLLHLALDISEMRRTRGEDHADPSATTDNLLGLRTPAYVCLLLRLLLLLLLAALAVILGLALCLLGGLLGGLARFALRLGLLGRRGRGQTRRGRGRRRRRGRRLNAPGGRVRDSLRVVLEPLGCIVMENGVGEVSVGGFAEASSVCGVMKGDYVDVFLVRI